MNNPNYFRVPPSLPSDMPTLASLTHQVASHLLADKRHDLPNAPRTYQMRLLGWLISRFGSNQFQFDDLEVIRNNDSFDVVHRRRHTPSLFTEPLTTRRTFSLSQLPPVSDVEPAVGKLKKAALAAEVKFAAYLGACVQASGLPPEIPETWWLRLVACATDPSRFGWKAKQFRHPIEELISSIPI